MKNKEHLVILYPDLLLEYKNGNCVVNYSYPKFEINEKDRPKFRVEKFVPAELSSLIDLYNLLNYLNEKSGKQEIILTKGKTKFSYLIKFLLGIPALIIPPLGLYLIILGVLGLMGFLNEKFKLPKVKVISNYSSQSNIDILNNLTCFFQNTLNCSVERLYENIDFDDGAKLLLYVYEAMPNYEIHYQFENKDGSPDLRHKNNPVSKILTHYSLKLMIPGFIYKSDIVLPENYEAFINKAHEIDESTKVLSIKLGNIKNVNSNNDN